MSYTKLLIGEPMYPRIESGVNQLCNIVKTTLGPAGRTVIIYNELGAPMATKDGVTVAESIRLEDQVEDIGAQTVKGVAMLSNKLVGDGTTTATVLAQALVNMSFKLMMDRKVKNVNTFKKGMLSGMEIAVDFLEEHSTHIEDNEEGLKHLRKIALISSNNDEEVANLIMDAYKITGNTGAVKVDIGNLPHSYVKEMKGMSYGNGMISGHLATDRERFEWSFKDAYVFVTDYVISTLAEIEPVLEYCVENKRPILIVCEDMEEYALRMLIMNIDNGHLKACVVKAPGFGSQKSERLTDIAVMTGGKAVLKDKMTSLKNLSQQKPESYLGVAGTAIVRKNEFTIVDGKGDIEKIEEHKAWVREQIELEKQDGGDAYMMDKHAERLAKMTSGVALIYVGADSTIEATERKHRVDDSIQALKAAEDGGFVRGGGLTLYAISQMGEIAGKDDFALGAQVFFASLKEPMTQILINAEKENELEDVDAFIANTEKFTKGVDLFNEGFIDYLEKGVIDPTKVSVSAIKNAVSICSTLITMGGVIYSKEPKFE